MAPYEETEETMADDDGYPTDEELSHVVLGTVISYEIKQFDRMVYGNHCQPVAREKTAPDQVLVTVETLGHRSSFTYSLKPAFLPWLEPGFRVTADMVQDPPGWPEGVPSRPARLPEMKTAWQLLLDVGESLDYD